MLNRDNLKQYQERSVQHIKDHAFSALFVDMGLGKTVSSLTAIADLKNTFDVNNVLVIGPLRVARKTWSDEIAKWAHVQHLSHAKIIGNPKKRLSGIDAEADIHLINRENIVWLVDQFLTPVGKLIKPWKWDAIIIDESRSFSNHQSKRWRALKRIRKYINTMVQLTGTPNPKGLMDLWAQVYLLDQGDRLGQTITAFRNRWFNPPGYNQFNWTPKDHAERQILKAISDICLSLRADDYLDLEPAKVNDIRVDLTEQQLKEYRRLEKDNVLELKDHTITAVNAGVLAGKLLQLANGAYYTENPEWEEFHNAKIEALLEVLESISGPVIVCYNFKFDLIRIKKALGKKKINYDTLTSEASEDKWNAGETDVLLIHPKSAGHGLNLHLNGCSDLIWFGLTYSLEEYLQANARITGGHRRGDRSVMIHRIISEQTVDNRVIEVLSENKQGQDRLFLALRQHIEELL